MKLFRFLGIFLFASQLVLAAPLQPIQNLTIIVSSCDKYVDLWPAFFTMFFRQWPSLLGQNQHVPVILITNEKDFEHPRVKTIKTGPDRGWSENMLDVLDQVNTDYILYIQEDYIFDKPVDEQRFQDVFLGMQAANAAYLEVSQDDAFKDDTPHPSIPGVVIKGRFHDAYRTSLQIAIWRKDVLKWLIKPHENPWRFEIDGSVRSQGMKEEFLAVTKDFPITFINACHSGYLMQPAVDYLTSQGVSLSDVKLPVDNGFRPYRWLQTQKWFIYMRDLKRSLFPS